MAKALDARARQERTELTGWYATTGRMLEREFFKAIDAADRMAKRNELKVTEKEIGTIMKLCAAQYEYIGDAVDVKRGRKLFRVKVV